MLRHVGDVEERHNGQNISYDQEVLLLQDETEDQLDVRLRQEAKELGIDVDAYVVQESKPQIARTASPSPTRRSQESVATQSTGFTSTFSDVSRDHNQAGSRTPWRNSLSFASGRHVGSNSMSFTPPTTPSQSTFSLPLSSPESSPKRHFRRIRGLSMLRLNRNSSSPSLNDTCPHCPQDPQSQRRAVHKLPCGHRLCTQALRNSIRCGSDGRPAIATCCGTPIPARIVELVRIHPERTVVMDAIHGRDRNDSVTESQPSQSRQRPSALSQESRTVSNESNIDAVIPRLQQERDEIMDKPEFKQLRQEQSDQRDRFLAWIGKQRAELEAQHMSLRAQMQARHESASEALSQDQSAAMADAEDKQVKAEADMRELQVREQRDNATALKHMEAYCAGTYSTGELHGRTITEQDRSELEKTRRFRDQMEVKHESAINVLRGEQSKRIRMRVQRQEKEEQELRRTQHKEELDLERACGEEMAELDDLVGDKRLSIRRRWQLQTAIFAKRLENVTGNAVEGRLPAVEWQQEKPLDQVTTSCGAESMLAESRKAGISTGMAVRGVS